MSLAQQLLQGNAAKKTGTFLPNVQRRNKASSQPNEGTQESTLNLTEKTDTLTPTTTQLSSNTVENPAIITTATPHEDEKEKYSIPTQEHSTQNSTQQNSPPKSSTIASSEEKPQQSNTSNISPPSSKQTQQTPSSSSHITSENAKENNDDDDDIVFMGETPAPFDSTLEAEEDKKKQKKKKKKKKEDKSTTKEENDSEKSEKSKKKKRKSSDEATSSSEPTKKKRKSKKDTIPSSSTEEVTLSEPKGVRILDYIYETEAGVPLKSSEKEQNSLAKKVGYNPSNNEEHTLDFMGNEEFVLHSHDQDMHSSHQDDAIIMDEEEEEDEEEEDSGNAPMGAELVPRLRIADDGSLVFDETATITHEKQVSHKDYVRVTETHRHITQYTFARRKRAEKWSQEETERFYSALRQFGVNFTLIGRLFPGRDRRQIKNKYKKEEKNNKEKVDYSLKHPLKIDLEMFQKYSNEKDELEGTVSKKKSESVIEEGEETGPVEDEEEFEEEVFDKSAKTSTHTPLEEEEEEWDTEDVGSRKKSSADEDDITQPSVIVEEDTNAHTNDTEHGDFEFNFY